MQNAKFTARSFNRSILEHRRPSSSCNSDGGKRSVDSKTQAQRLNLAPFNLMTEERGRLKSKQAL